MTPERAKLFESLFDSEYENTQPLRKYEPLIRVNMAGEPLPRRLLSPDSIQPIQPLPIKPDPPKPIEKQQQPQQQAKPQTQQQAPINDKKRSVPENAESKMEPKKKQPKGQSKITSFFNKS